MPGPNPLAEQLAGSTAPPDLAWRRAVAERLAADNAPVDHAALRQTTELGDMVSITVRRDQLPQLQTFAATRATDALQTIVGSSANLGAVGLRKSADWIDFARECLNAATRP